MSLLIQELGEPIERQEPGEAAHLPAEYAGTEEKRARGMIVVIGGIVLGEATPSQRGEHYKWHVVLRLKDDSGYCFQLLQGFGDSPEQAVIDGVVRARRERDAFIEKLMWLEQELGTACLPDQQLNQELGP